LILGVNGSSSDKILCQHQMLCLLFFFPLYIDNSYDHDSS
jgi:hypothetical protein